jgi:hypothetical protein
VTLQSSSPCEERQVLWEPALKVAVTVCIIEHASLFGGRRWNPAADESECMHVLICGGGAIGASTAYFLSCRGLKATVIESAGLACAASGKSGGFLARDWCDGTPLAPLARRSFALHDELNEKLAGNWGYRRLDTYGGIAGFPARRGAYRLAWLSSKVRVDQALGSRDSTENSTGPAKR